MPVNASSFPAPSAATIAAAVAAPSAATIATAVAAAVPTTAGITTIVQNNGATQTTWTLLGSVIADPGTSSVTISSIPTTYKSLRIEVMGVILSTTDTLALRYNGDSNGVYSWYREYSYGTVSGGSASSGDNQQRFNATGAMRAANNRIYASTILQNYSNASERSKFWSANNMHVDSNVESNFVRDYGTYRPASASAVTSVTLFSISGAVLSGFGVNGQSGFFIYGGN